MAYNGKHLAKLDDLKALGTKQKEVADALAARVDTLENVGSQANVLEGVKVNGTALSIANKMVDILIATGSKNGSISVNGADVAIKGLAALAFKAKVSQSDLDEALAAILEGKADKATTLDGYGITNAYTKDEINAKISAVYKPAGAVAFAELPSLSESILGNVYNVTDAFTTTANFVEGAGNKYPKGLTFPPQSRRASSVPQASQMYTPLAWRLSAPWVSLSGILSPQRGHSGQPCS